MFTGLDDLDWAALRHAYGTAEGVPELLRGLLDPDPATREVALDAMYGAVHHQGSVYDSTVAAVPFLLEALRTPALPGRAGIAEFLASVAENCSAVVVSNPTPAGADNFGPAKADNPSQSEADNPNPAKAGEPGPTRAEISGIAEAHEAAAAGMARASLRLIEEAVPGLIGLADDPDPKVRAAVSQLLALHRDGVAVLITRAAAESDPEARTGMIEGLGRSADPAVAEHLISVAAEAPRASASVAALIAAAHITPERVPTDGITELLQRAYAEEAEPAEPAGFETDTLIGAIRVHRERADQGRRNPAVARSIDSFARLLGPRVAERTAILTELLRDPHPDIVQDALFGAGHLIERWRGDYRELVDLVAAQLPNPGAERGLNHWVPLSAPAADALAAQVARGDGLVHHEIGLPSLSPALSALIDLGDERAFEPLVAIVERPEHPRDAVQRLRGFPQHADRILDLLLASDAEPDDLATALALCGAAARPAVPRILSVPVKSWTADALGRIGGDQAIDALRAALRGNDVSVALAAAEALWRLESSSEAIEVLGAHLTEPGALPKIAAIGPAAGGLLKKIRPLLESSGKAGWVSTNAALAVWRIAGDAEAATPALVAGWNGNEHARRRIAEQAGGVPALLPLFEAELAEVRRAGTDEYSFSSSQVADDEKLQDSITRSIAARERRVSRR
ncbi:HEAT repeat domain-containing protein [Paractinoplanes toevensis]|uniref:HEAT repeat domain-containing protein n=1 Tax=Paractinoplanes toevensis TaxID=571911 RepID=A0A919WC30_9ACTN|nr:HEAT repeat domain-containing protein [Actinoplanes toevensis]GIM97430.1 hypothetical protein Ato02nite_092230 [Actinoplanes toevensis]